MNAKQKVVFWSLKLIEVFGIIFLPYFLAMFLAPLTYDKTPSGFQAVFVLWVIGVLGLIVIACSVCIIYCFVAYLLTDWVSLNKKWAKRITED